MTAPDYYSVPPLNIHTFITFRFNPVSHSYPAGTERMAQRSISRRCFPLGEKEDTMETGESLFVTIWIAFYASWLISAWKTRSPVKRKQSRLSYFLYGIVWVTLCLVLVNWLSPDIIGTD